MLEQIHQENPDVRVVFRHFPLPSHNNSLLAAQAAEAAGLQDKFWDMHELLFTQQAAWVQKRPDEFKTWLL